MLRFTKFLDSDVFWRTTVKSWTSMPNFRYIHIKTG